MRCAPVASHIPEGDTRALYFHFPPHGRLAYELPGTALAQQPAITKQGSVMTEQNEVPRDSTMKSEARAMWGDAKSTARSAADSQQRAAAQGLEDFAGALRGAARNPDAEKGVGTHIAEAVAENLERLSSTLKNRNFDTLVRDVEDFARAQPLVFFGAAVATGFLAMRFLKSSGRETGATDYRHGYGSEPSLGERYPDSSE
jgi:hypothetical protein